jgi:FkbM family methyltransferase
MGHCAFAAQSCAKNRWTLFCQRSLTGLLTHLRLPLWIRTFSDARFGIIAYGARAGVALTCRFTATPVNTPLAEPTTPEQQAIAKQPKAFLGRLLFDLANHALPLRPLFAPLGRRCKPETLIGRTGMLRLPNGTRVKLASIANNYLSFQLFWHGAYFYEPLTSALVETLTRRPCVFVDVGANVGYYSLLVASGGNEARVLAIEPNPKISALLRRNVEANRLPIETFDLALSERSGSARLFIAKSDHSATLASDFEAAFVGDIEVPTECLDTFLEKHAPRGHCVIKIDVEGHEEKVLLGATRTLTDRNPDIIIEASRPQKNSPLNWLSGLGYRAYSITDEGLRWTLDWSPTVRDGLVFLNLFLSKRAPAEVETLSEAVKLRAASVDLRKSSKLADPVVLKRAAMLA